MNPATIDATPSDPSTDRVAVYAITGASGSGRIVVNVPLTIPRDQTYYWSAEWQRAEQESLAEIAAGNSILFDSDDPEDVARWLSEDDEDSSPSE